MTATLYERVEAASNLVALGERARDEDPAVSAAAMGAAEALLLSIQNEFAPAVIPGSFELVSEESLVSPAEPTEPVEVPEAVSPPAETKPAASKKPKTEKPKQEPKADEAPAQETPAVTKEQVLNAAKDFMKRQSPEAFQVILKELGIKRASECPDDRLAELLARVATA